MHLACPGLVRSLERGDTIVVPSTLLASIAAEQFSQHQLSHSRETWQRPSIYSIGAWLAVCWRDARFREAAISTLLSPSQEHALWLRIVEREHPELFDASRMALLASRAAHLLAEWHIPTEGESWNEHADARQFQHWHRLFRRECRARDWITRADLWKLLPEWILKGGSATGATRFTAFDTRTPALARILDALGDRAILETANSAMPANLSVNMAIARPSKDFTAELEFAARRARATLEGNPRQSIGIFVSGLAGHAAGVERLFEQVLRPASLFHIHAGPPLADQPLIASARLLLELAQPVIHYADASSMLRSPFLPGAAAERSARAIADIGLRKRRELDFSLADIEQAAFQCPALLAICRRLRRVLPSKTETKELPGWSRFISDWLEVAGWPGDAELTEQEEKIVDLWNEALSGLAALGLVSPAVTFDSALTHLRRLLSKSVEAGNWLSPVQVLDASDAANLEFVSAIAVGLSEETWPPRETLSPLVPFALQRAHKVPGSTMQSAREQREDQTAALFRAAPEVVATYSGRLAPLAERFVRREFVDTGIWTGQLPRQSYLKASLERLEDSQGPALVAAETVKGGASLIKAQSLCPFKAFAEYRLAAQAPEEACFGFDARERGGFLHKAVENVWARLGSQSALRATPPEDLRLLIQSAVAAAIGHSATGSLHQLVSRAEQERLERIVWDWLAVERVRKQPFVVETVEQETHFEAFGLRLRLRVDRIDRLENGHVLLIDYKSGSQSRNKLKGARPKEPQLLVYAASSSDPVDGIFFAEMKANEVRAVGVSREKQFESRSVDVKKHEWASFLEESRAEVGRLAEQFVNGYAVVDPLPQVCNYCASRPLCRVQETGGQGEEEEC
jgi:ATP-dependent helicase/nuclease subunit B